MVGSAIVLGGFDAFSLLFRMCDVNSGCTDSEEGIDAALGVDFNEESWKEHGVGVFAADRMVCVVIVFVVDGVSFLCVCESGDSFSGDGDGK